ncbi:hypothetical protein BH09PAT1_BH09PAT1_3380 [soil metagenome]
MKGIKYYIKLIPAFALYPIADPLEFLKIFVVTILLVVVVILPIVVFGLLIGIGIKIGNNVVTLYNLSTSDTKILVIIGVASLVVPAIGVLPVIIPVFIRVRSKAKKMLKE